MKDFEEQQEHVSSNPKAGDRRQDDALVDLVDYLEILVRQRWTIIWVSLLVTAGTVAPGLFREDTVSFWAEVNLVVEEAPAPTGGQAQTPIRPDMIHGYSLAKHVLDSRMGHSGGGDSVSVAKYLGGNTVGASHEILRSKTALQVGSSGFVAIRVSDPDSVASVHIAKAYVAGLRGFFADVKERRVTRELSYVDRRLSEVGASLIEAEDSVYTFRRKYLGGMGDGERHEVERELGRRQRKVNSWAKVYNTLLSHQETIRMRAQEGDTRVDLLSSASGRTVESHGFSVKKAAVGIGVGGALGIFLAFVRDYVQRLTRMGGGERLRKAYRGES